MQMCVTEVGHMMQRNMWCNCDKMSVVGLGLGGLRDRSGTKGRTGHNSFEAMVLKFKM